MSLYMLGIRADLKEHCTVDRLGWALVGRRIVVFELQYWDRRNIHLDTTRDDQ